MLFGKFIIISWTEKVFLLACSVYYMCVCVDCTLSPHTLIVTKLYRAESCPAGWTGRMARQTTGNSVPPTSWLQGASPDPRRHLALPPAVPRIPCSWTFPLSSAIPLPRARESPCIAPDWADGRNIRARWASTEVFPQETQLLVGGRQDVTSAMPP